MFDGCPPTRRAGYACSSAFVDTFDGPMLTCLT